MAIDLHTAEITGYWLSITNTEGHIDNALDHGDRRAFGLWCKKRDSLSTRLQRALLLLATNGMA